MLEAAGLFFGALVAHRVFLEVSHAALEVCDQQIGQVAADSVAHQDAHDHQVLPVGRHRVCRDLPTAHADAVGKIEEVETGIHTLFQRPAHGRNAAAAVVDDLKRAQLVDLIGQILGRVVAGLLDLSVAFLAQAQEVVVLGHDLSAGSREVQRESGHVAAQVIDPEK